MNDWWIDETPPREGDVEREVISLPGWLAKWTYEAMSDLSESFAYMSKVFVRLHSEMQPESKPKPPPRISPPTNKRYPTSELINQTRKTRRR